MFTNSDQPIGHAYDPNLQHWYLIKMPFIETSNRFVSSSYGLVCFMNNGSGSELCMSNPITKSFRKLQEPPGMRLFDYGALAISVNKESHGYTVAIVKSKLVPDNFTQWEISILMYNSEEKTWSTPLTKILTGWRGGNESVICNGVLYFVAYYTGGVQQESRHALVTYNTSNLFSQDSLSFIPMPCSLTCGRLMNMKEKLVMVGGIAKHDRPDIIKGIGIWVLHDRKWENVVRMPYKYFQGFGEVDDSFCSSGIDDLIYIQSYGGPALLTFDMKFKQWKWSQRCPVTKRCPLDLFRGFCFEPRLEIAP